MNKKTVENMQNPFTIQINGIFNHQTRREQTCFPNREVYWLKNKPRDDELLK